MKKVLILSYFYPPANFVGGERVASWAKHLHKFGYYPVIITRNWNPNQADLTDCVEDNKLHHEVHDTHEVYRLPYNRSLRDKLNDFPRNKVASILRRALSVFELVFSNFFTWYIPYSNIFFFAKKLIKEQTEFKTLIVSGRPFQLFFFAYRLKKETGINWIADYRDEWNIRPSRIAQSMLERFIFFLENKSELKWTSNCTAFLTVSDHWVNTISEFIHKPGYKVMNGYEPTQFQPVTKTQSKDSFTITYSGSLYLSQSIDVFIDSLLKLIDNYKDRIMIHTNFIGITVMPEPTKLVKKLITGYEEYFTISDRIPVKDAIQLQVDSDLLIATGYKNEKGCYPVKIFEYYASGTTVLLCPSDSDVIEEFILSTNTGYVANTPDECYGLLVHLVESKINGKSILLDRNKTVALEYTRENQAKKLASVLNSIESNY